MVGGGNKIPLFVVLHGGGMGITGTYLWEAMPISDELMCDICYIPEDFYGLLVEVRTQDDWWGVPKNPEYNKKSKSSEVVKKPIPKKKSETETRVLEQVEWVASNFAIDRNRIYLGGASMGGSGTLGLGLPNGDIFAAVKANVSATPYHGVARLGLGGKLNAVPDPPPLVEYSSQNDIWSVDKDMLYNGMDDARYAYYAYWGAFGHSGRNSRVLPKVDLVGSFNIFDNRADDKSECPLVVVHTKDAYKDFREGGDEIVPEGSWALFVAGGNSAKELEKNKAVKECVIEFAKKRTGVKTVEVYTPPVAK